MEAFNTVNKFITPDFVVEAGEFKRTGEHFGIDESTWLFTVYKNEA